ncbi:MAG: ABC transporter ATP-binding protein [Clostridia bacterium]|nr:ABC transporter ATP-binding protein [Clostridia bacterium]
MEPLVKIKDLKKYYRVGDERIEALRGINLDIPQGEFISIVGTSGSGKSTLLNIMSGLERPTKGEIIIGKASLNKIKEKRLSDFRRDNIGFIFQSYNLLAPLTALENTVLPLIFRGIGKKEREIRGKEILKIVGLEDRMHNRPNQMSGGQQQRVSIARALINNPKIIFADEPTGNLDSKTTEEILELLIKSAKENNSTLVMVTHDPVVAARADRSIHLKDGLIIKEEIFNHEESN